MKFIFNFHFFNREILTNMLNSSNLQESEIDDSRPTVIKEFSSTPKFISVLSGKINTVYDLDTILS